MSSTAASLTLLATLAAASASALPTSSSTAFAPQPLAAHAMSRATSCRTRPAFLALKMKGARGDGKVNRRVILALTTLPLLGIRKAGAMTEAEEIAKLQAEAARIQEIFDVQKEAARSLPSLKDSLKAAKSAPAPTLEESMPAVDVVQKSTDVTETVKALMTALQKDGDKGMELVLANSGDGNPLKTMPVDKVCNMMRQTKLALLLDGFTRFEILPPKDLGTDAQGATKSQVDVLVKAPYQTMLQNGMQFADMKMGDEKDKLCTATYRWQMKKTASGQWVNLGCRVVDPIA